MSANQEKRMADDYVIKVMEIADEITGICWEPL